MRILIIGENGQLGKSIYKIIDSYKNKKKCSYIFVGRDKLDLNNRSNIVNYFRDNYFDIVINCAAHTAVDKAEEEEEDLAGQINHLAVAQLAKIAKKQQAKLIHISTDYVFDGESDKPYTETDITSPINIYGKTKLAGENSIKEIMKYNATIIRTSWLYSDYKDNFVDTMLKLKNNKDKLNIVSDQIGSPTYATDLAEAILMLVNDKDFISKKQKTIIYHYSNSGKCSWYEFAKEIFRQIGVINQIIPINSQQFTTQAKRPKYSVMDSSKLNKAFNMETRDWKKSLKKCIYNRELLN